MPPDSYLRFAAAFISYFVKVAIAYLLCWVLSRLLNSPRQRFSVWLTFILASLGYWIYVLQSFFWSPQLSGIAVGGSGNIHQFLLSLKFQRPTVILGRLFGWTYVAGVLVLLLVGAGKRIRLHFLLQRGTAPALELKNLFSEMCRHFGVRNCELLVLPNFSSPATVCWWRPRILLPLPCGELGDSAVMADVLYHELAHVARRDYLWSSVSDLVCRLLFFHPGIWQAKNQMSIHREMACDLAVVAARPEHRVDYAQTLTCVARLCLPRKHPVIGIDFAAAPSLLAHRVRALLDTPCQDSRKKNALRAIMGMALIGGYVFLCSVIALAIAFEPAAHPARSVDLRTAPKSQARSVVRHTANRRGDAASAVGTDGLISESPAYRMTTSSATSAYPVQEQRGYFEAGTGNEPGNTNIPGWASPHPASTSGSTGRTVVESVIVAVGTAIGIDREDRKHKDGSSGTH